jgi:hypothetical protein
VAQINLQIGEREVPGAQNKAPILLIDFAPRRIRTYVSESDFALLHHDEIVKARVPALGNRMFKAQLERHVPVANIDASGNTTIPAIFRFTQYDNTIPVGASADLELPTRGLQRGYTVPVQAVEISEQGPRVFVIEDHTLRAQEVKLAGREGSQYRVISGLHGNEQLALANSSSDLRADLRTDLQTGLRVQSQGERVQAAGRRESKP